METELEFRALLQDKNDLSRTRYVTDWTLLTNSSRIKTRCLDVHLPNDYLTERELIRESHGDDVDKLVDALLSEHMTEQKFRSYFGKFVTHASVVKDYKATHRNLKELLKEIGLDAHKSPYWVMLARMVFLFNTVAINEIKTALTGGTFDRPMFVEETGRYLTVWEYFNPSQRILGEDFFQTAEESAVSRKRRADGSLVATQQDHLLNRAISLCDCLNSAVLCGDHGNSYLINPYKRCRVFDEKNIFVDAYNLALEYRAVADGSNEPSQTTKKKYPTYKNYVGKILPSTPVRSELILPSSMEVYRPAASRSRRSCVVAMFDIPAVRADPETGVMEELKEREMQVPDSNRTVRWYLNISIWKPLRLTARRRSFDALRVLKKKVTSTVQSCYWYDISGSHPIPVTDHNKIVTNFVENNTKKWSLFVDLSRHFAPPKNDDDYSYDSLSEDGEHESD